jgi:hypothetical protein
MHRGENAAVRVANCGIFGASRSSSFLTKRTKKLLRSGPSLPGEAEAKSAISFLLLFFKKEDLPAPYPASGQP